MKDLIQSYGGKVMSFETRYYYSYSANRSHYWWDINKSGGTIVEQATHFCDIARYLVGDVDESTIQTLCEYGFWGLVDESRINSGESLLQNFVCPSSQPNFLHFHAVFMNIWPNNRLAPPPLGLVPPSANPVIFWTDKYILVCPNREGSISQTPLVPLKNLEGWLKIPFTLLQLFNLTVLMSFSPHSD